MDDPRLVKRKGRVIPFGWKVYIENTDFLLPVPKELEALKRANEMIAEGYTWRAVQDWVIRASDRSISLEGLRHACKRVAGQVYDGRHNAVELPVKSGVFKAALKNPTELEKRNYHISRAHKAKLAIKRKKTAAQQELTQVTSKLNATKLKIAKHRNALNSAKNIINGKSTIIETEAIALTTPLVRKELYDPERPVIFEPNPGPQTQFLAATEKEVFYGGARGGGKSYSLLVDPLRFCNKEVHRALIIRRTMPELRDLINHSHRLYEKVYPGAKWREQEKEWKFPSGARIEFGYAETVQDALRYQGQSYTWIGVDELPQYPEPQIWNDLRGSLRSTDPTVPEYMRATGNPGNVGSAWVKDMFINPATPNTRFYEEVDMLDGTIEKISRKFIPAKLQDNPYLTRTRSYMAMLASLPEIQRRQWLEGDWDAWDGAAFPEFRRELHVCEPFEVPKGWVKFRSCDWGYSTAFCVLWFAIDYDYNLWVYREFYGNKLTADVFARRVKELDKEDRIQFGVMDASAWSQRGETGPAIPEVMRLTNGLAWRPSDRSKNQRKNGKMEVHRRLAKDEDTLQPKIKIFSNCKQLIRDLPILPLDKDEPEDVDTDFPFDHSYDALRYGVMARPLGPARMDWINQMVEAERFAPADTIFGY